MKVPHTPGVSTSPSVNKAAQIAHQNGSQKGTTTPTPAEFYNKHPVKVPLKK